MLTEDSASYFYLRLFEIYESTGLDNREKLLKLRSVFREIFKTITKSDSQIFSSLFAKTIYALDKFNVPDELSVRIKHLRAFLANIAQNRQRKITQIDVKKSIRTLCRALEFFSGLTANIELKKIFDDIDDPESTPWFSSQPKEFLQFIKAVVVKKGVLNTPQGNKPQTAEIFCETDEYGIVRLVVSNIWIDTWKYAKENVILNLFDIKVTRSKEITFTTTSNSLIVLEPDYLVDATELAECFQQNGANVNLFFLKKFMTRKTKIEAVAGNLVNFCFDELIGDPDVDFETVYYKGLKVKPLQAIAIASQNRTSVIALREKVSRHFDNLQNKLPELQCDSLSLEPTFLSPKYGLQGRLDALLEYDDEPNRKNIVELKSGKPPGADISILNYDGNRVRTGVWNSNFAQITCYNLLLDSTFENRTGSSQILYSASSEFPFRNAPNIIQKKQELLAARNKIIAIENLIAAGDYRLFERFNMSGFGDIPPFLENDVYEFDSVYKSASELEKEYFHIYISFIINEIKAAKLGTSGNSGNNGFSSLWSESIEEKESSMTILSQLQLNLEESDLDNMHLVFTRNTASEDITSLRKGDLGIIYKIPQNGSTNPLNQQILKCSVKEIDDEKVKISLRNKQLRKEYFSGDDKWVLEPDSIDSLNKALFSSVYQFLKADQNKKDLLLGLRQPVFNDSFEIENDELNQNQQEILKSCLSAQDYYLLQGPPGTGKTSYMLKSIVKSLFEQTEENILVLAYTNRAVDEICSALKNISDDFPFLRLGSKESTIHPEYLIANIAEEHDLNFLFKTMKSTRVIVSTVSSVLANYELFEIKSFDTAIVDEASQILEPQLIGILTRVSRFILIGDEKQLPAIVLQDEEQSLTDSPLLNSVHLHKPGGSLFERLLKCSKSNGWSEASGMLSHQARMHKDIQKIVNQLFYNNTLEVFNPEGWQGSETDDFIEGSRVVFIPSELEKGNKVNRGEALAVAMLVESISNTYKEQFNDKTVGVISPFRAQCAEIIRNLNPALRKLVTVDTVERFQGSERDIIIISFAVNHPYLLQNISSAVEIDGCVIDRKLNVAITRAKKKLILLGCPEILKQSEVFDRLISLLVVRC